MSERRNVGDIVIFEQDGIALFGQISERDSDRELTWGEMVKGAGLLYLIAFIGPLAFIASSLLLSAVLWYQYESAAWVLPLALLFLAPAFPVVCIIYHGLKRKNPC